MANKIYQYAVIGDNVTKSKSPKIFKILFEKYNIRAEYTFLEKYNLDKESLRQILLLLDGANITSPYKYIAGAACNKVINNNNLLAVNTVLNKNGYLIGYNTDAFGVFKSFESIKNKTHYVLLLGAGGAAVSAAKAITTMNKKLYVYNRTFSKAESLAKIFSAVAIKRLKDIPKEHITIVNTVPNKNFVFNVLENLEVNSLYFVDAIYPSPPYRNHKKIIKYIKGEKWLIGQALESFHIFTSIKPKKDIENYLEKVI